MNLAYLFWFFMSFKRRSSPSNLFNLSFFFVVKSLLACIDPDLGKCIKHTGFAANWSPGPNLLMVDGGYYLWGDPC